MNSFPAASWETSFFSIRKTKQVVIYIFRWKYLQLPKFKKTNQSKNGTLRPRRSMENRSQGQRIARQVRRESTRKESSSQSKDITTTNWHFHKVRTKAKTKSISDDVLLLLLLPPRRWCFATKMMLLTVEPLVMQVTVNNYAAVSRL